jgi:hypothetical protein
LAIKHVLIELWATPPLREAFLDSPFEAVAATVDAAPSDIPGVTLDESFPLIAIPPRARAFRDRVVHLRLRRRPKDFPNTELGYLRALFQPEHRDV